MISKILFLPIEFKSREFYPKLYFANKALDKNFACFFGDKAGIFRATKYFNNGIYFYKSINATDTNHIKAITKKNNKYIVLDEEGGFTYTLKKEMEYFLSHRTSKKNINLIDKFFNWGKFDYSHCIKKYPLHKKKFIISGGLRFEISKKTIVKKLYQDQINEIKKKFGNNFILLVSSAGVTSKKEVHQMLNSYTYFMDLKTKQQKKDRYKKLSEMYNLNKDYREIIVQLAKNFPYQKFVLRPHPSENLDDWNVFFKDHSKILSNFHVDAENDLNALIYCSIGIISSKSAAALVATQQDKAIVTYLPKYLKHGSRIVDNIGFVASNKKNLIKLVEKNLIRRKGKFKSKVSRRLKENVNNFASQKEPSKIMLNEIDKIYKLKSEISVLLIMVLSPIYFVSDFLLKIFKIKYYNPKLFEKSYRSPDEKMNYSRIKKSEVNLFFKNMRKNNDIKILSFGKNSFLIYKKN